MVNESQSRLNHMWAKWRKSGSIGNMSTTFDRMSNIIEVDTVKTETIKDQELKNKGIQISVDGYEVVVRELTDDIATAAREDRDYISLGDSKVELAINYIQGVSRDQATQVFLLSWEGNKIPRGIVINDSIIDYTQNGIVSSAEGEMMGTYDRIEEFGGDSGRLQRMVVFPFPTGS